MSQHNTQVDVFNLKYQKIGLDCILLTVKWLCHCSVPASGFFCRGEGLLGFAGGSSGSVLVFVCILPIKSLLGGRGSDGV